MVTYNYMMCDDFLTIIELSYCNSFWKFRIFKNSNCLNFGYILALSHLIKKRECLFIIVSFRQDTDFRIHKSIYKHEKILSCNSDW